MAEEELKLYGAWGSPMSRRVQMALKLKGVPYQYIEEDLSDKSPELLKYNPIHKKVPVLVHHGNPIAESQIILEYIDETWKTDRSLLPEDPYDRAMARFWSRFIDDKCLPSIRAVWRGPGEEKEKLKEEAHGNLKMLEEQLKDKRFFGGESIGFLDICGNVIAYWIVVIQEVAGVEVLTEEKFPTLWKWTEEFRGSADVKEHLPDKDRMSAYLGTHFGSSNASK